MRLILFLLLFLFLSCLTFPSHVSSTWVHGLREGLRGGWAAPLPADRPAWNGTFIIVILAPTSTGHIHLCPLFTVLLGFLIVLNSFITYLTQVSGCPSKNLSSRKSMFIYLFVCLLLDPQRKSKFSHFIPFKINVRNGHQGVKKNQIKIWNQCAKRPLRGAKGSKSMSVVPSLQA